MSPRRALPPALYRRFPFLQEVLDGMPASVKVVDERFRVVWANETARRESGHDLPDLRGRVCCQYLQGFRQNCPWCPVVRVFRDGKPHVHTYDRRGRSMEVTGYLLPSGKDGTRYAVEIARDVTPVATGEALRGRAHFPGQPPPDGAIPPGLCASGLGDPRDAAERERLLKALRRTRGRMGAAARDLGVSVKTLQRRMRKFSLDFRTFRGRT